MKFTPETLLKIYLDGSFTEEAQAEFDALMRKDPAFSERVTQAVAERLGPLSDAKIDETASRLDGKIDGIWNHYKPSPVLRSLKLSGKIALMCVSAGALYFGARHLWPILQASINGQPSGTAFMARPQSVPEILSGNESRKGTTLTENPEKKDSTAQPKSVQASKSLDSGLKVSSRDGILNPLSEGNSFSSPSVISSNDQKDVTSNLPITPNSVGSSRMGGGTSMVPIERAPSNGASKSPLSVVPALSAGPSSTAEGDSLRVSIDTAKTQNVIVTVYDSNGLLIRHLYQGMLGAGEHYVDWDGKDELGNAVIPGDYNVVLDLGDKKMSGILKVLPVK